MKSVKMPPFLTHFRLITYSISNVSIFELKDFSCFTQFTIGEVLLSLLEKQVDVFVAT